MSKTKTFSVDIAGRPLHLEIGGLAGQANGAVLARYGETIVLATAVISQSDALGDFFPLTVNYEEKFYAAGKILGSRFVRREGRSSDKATLTSRLIDRSVRPLFPEAFRREVQIIITTFSLDEDNDPDFVSLIAASTALAISNIPWAGPVGGVGVSKIGDSFVINPTLAQLKNGVVSYSAFFAGVRDKINMIEVAASESAEDDIISGLKTAVTAINKLIAFQEDIIKSVGKPKADISLPTPPPPLVDAVHSFLSNRLDSVLFLPDKSEREAGLSTLRQELEKELASGNWTEDDLQRLPAIFETEVSAAVHKAALENSRRVDGRALDAIRPLSAAVHIFDRPHGTGLFSRGETQALATTTLAPPGQEKLEETAADTVKKHFFLHYNFPPFSTGEVKPLRSPGRREIGHGALAEKALRPLMPSLDEFPYTVRVVSEILSSNGSSSMATVCASCLSLMDAGVPIKKPVAGIAMGIMTGSGGAYKILTDIQGPEDHYGDMDFKVAGTRDGVTAVQMDVKVNGITPDILAEGLAQARRARLEILDVMTGAIASPRPEISPYAPHVFILKINPEKIGELIGPGGKIINGIIARTGATIDIEDDGTVFIGGLDADSLNKALAEVKDITREFAIGEIIEGKIIKIMEFGAIVDLGGGRDGMIHVSELKNGFVKKVEDVVKLGDLVRAKVVKIENGRVGLSLKALSEK